MHRLQMGVGGSQLQESGGTQDTGRMLDQSPEFLEHKARTLSKHLEVDLGEKLSMDIEISEDKPFVQLNRTERAQILIIFISLLPIILNTAMFKIYKTPNCVSCFILTRFNILQI